MSNMPNGLRLVITIVDRGKGKKITKIFEKIGCYSHNIVLGYGTASEDILEYLGLGTIEKDVVFSVADETVVAHMLEILNVEMNFASPGHGIACSIPIQSIASKTTLDAILGKKVLERK